MAKFRLGDIVRVVRPSTNSPNQQVDFQSQQEHEIIEVCQLGRFKRALGNGNFVDPQMYDLLPTTNYFMDEMSLELAFASMSPVPDSVANWGSAPPITSNSGRKISDDERRLIELRIATRRALHGGE